MIDSLPGNRLITEIPGLKSKKTNEDQKAAATGNAAEFGIDAFITSSSREIKNTCLGSPSFHNLSTFRTKPDTIDIKDAEKILAIHNELKAEKLWEFQTDDTVFSSPCFDKSGTVYVGSRDGRLYAINNGKKLWEFQTGDTLLSSPCIDSSGTVYIASGSKVYAIKDGKKLWSCKPSGYVIASSPCTDSSGIVYIGSNDKKIYAIGDGKKIWEYKTEGLVLSSPLVDSLGIVYAGSNDNKMYALKDGKKLWEFETGGHISSSPVMDHDGVIYFGSGDRKLYAIKSKSPLAEALERNENEQENDIPSIQNVDEWIIIGNIKLKKNA